MNNSKNNFKSGLFSINDGDCSIDVYGHANLNPTLVSYYFGEKVVDKTPKDALSLTLPDNFSYSPNSSSFKPKTVNPLFETSKGLATAKVNVSTTDAKFRGILASIPFDVEGALLTGTELIGNQVMQSLLENMKKLTPIVGSTGYTFPLGIFLNLLVGIQGQHPFHLS